MGQQKRTVDRGTHSSPTAHISIISHITEQELKRLLPSHPDYQARDNHFDISGFGAAWPLTEQWHKRGMRA